MNQISYNEENNDMLFKMYATIHIHKPRNTQLKTMDKRVIDSHISSLK